MSRPRLLDMFCCAGGAAKGYHDAGFDVVGAGYLKRGALYRVRERVPACHAYWLEGIEGIGFWATRLARPQATYSRSGPIVRLAVRQHLEQGATAS